MTPAQFYSNTRRSDTTDCLLWTGAIKSNGYGNLSFEGKVQSAHRVSYMLANGPIPKGARVLHSCDVRACVEPSHLSLGSARDNSRQMVERGRYRGPARLSPSVRQQVRSAVASGLPQRVVGEHFGVSQATISNIVRGKHAGLSDARWAHRPESQVDVTATKGDHA